MSSRSRHVHATSQEVWEVLADGWLYPLWVVGATRMRAVDPGWPSPGARLHHSAGVWPLVIDDTTEVVEASPPTSLVLRARGWPAGEAQVVIEVTPEGTGTRVVIREDAVRGPGRWVPAPVRHPLIAFRNVEALRRLAALVEGR